MPAQRRLSDYLDTGTVQRDPYGPGDTRTADANVSYQVPIRAEGDGGWGQTRTTYVGPTWQSALGSSSGQTGGYDAHGNRVFTQPTGPAAILRGQVGSQNLLYQNLFALLNSDGHDYQGLNRQIGDIGHGTDSLRQAQSAGLASRGVGNSGLAHALDAAAASGGVERVSDARAAENSQAMQRRLQIQQMAEDELTGRRLTARGQDQAVNAARASQARSGGGWMGILGSLLGAAGNSGLLGGGGGGKPGSGSNQGQTGGYYTGNSTGNYPVTQDQANWWNSGNQGPV